MRYDVCVIGAGPDGLAAATILARAGLAVLVVERGAEPGGRCRMREFHPGFRASPFVDELAPMPPELCWSLGLARAGAITARVPASVALWPDRSEVLLTSDLDRLGGPVETLRAAALAHAGAEAQRLPTSGLRILSRETEATAWPGAELGDAALAEYLAAATRNEATRAHLMARGLEGRTADPFLFGSALHLIAPGCGNGGMFIGGPDRLAGALAQVARAAGAEIRCGVDVADIRRGRERVTGVTLGDGTEIAAGAVVSTLDLKRTFLSFFQWNALPPEISQVVSAFRFCGSTARLLIALDASPDLSRAGMPEASRSPLYINPDVQDFAFARAAWRSGAIPDAPPIVARIVSASDPTLAPIGAATLTLTVGGVPNRLFDGPWTHEKRALLRDRALAAVEAVLPGTLARIQAVETIVPPDIEEEIGATDGDLWGGEVAADQMFDLRPGFATPAPRTPLLGLYLAGPSTAAGALATGLSGALAASAVIADRKAGRLR